MCRPEQDRSSGRKIAHLVKKLNIKCLRFSYVSFVRQALTFDMCNIRFLSTFQMFLIHSCIDGGTQASESYLEIRHHLPKVIDWATNVTCNVRKAHVSAKAICQYSKVMIYNVYFGCVDL